VNIEQLPVELTPTTSVTSKRGFKDHGAWCPVSEKLEQMMVAERDKRLENSAKRVASRLVASIFPAVKNCVSGHRPDTTPFGSAFLQRSVIV